MQNIYLIRHGKSSWKDGSLHDIDRPLKKRGLRNSKAMGRRLASRSIRPDLILTSGAVRAQRTAQLIAAEVGCERLECIDQLYPGSMSTYLDCLETFSREADCIFLVAHNYGLTELAWYLTGKEFQNVVTCGVVGICYNDRFVPTEGAGRLLFYDYPKKYDADLGQD